MFLTLAEEQDLRRAAQRCKVTQRSLRKEVATLEVEYGTPLFAIHLKRVRLTEAGDRLRRSLYSVDDWNLAMQPIRLVQDPMSEHRIAEWMSGAAKQAWPNIHIQVRKANSEQQITRLDLGLADLGMVYGWPPLPHSQISFLRLYDQEVVGFVAQGTPPAPESFRLHEIQKRPWVIPSASVMPQLGNLLVWEAQKLGFYPRTIWAHTMAQFIDSIRSDMSVGLAPSNFLPVIALGLMKVRIEPRVTVPFGCLHRTREGSNAVHLFLNLCSKLTQSQRIS